MFKHVFCKTKQGYNNALSLGQISSQDIVYVEDSQEILTRNICFSNGKSLDIISTTVQSDSDGKITIPDIDGYSFFNAVAYNLGQPLVTVRFGDYWYVGYYGGASTPTSSSVVDLLFTSVANADTIIYYIKAG